MRQLSIESSLRLLQSEVPLLLRIRENLTEVRLLKKSDTRSLYFILGLIIAVLGGQSLLPFPILSLGTQIAGLTFLGIGGAIVGLGALD